VAIAVGFPDDQRQGRIERMAIRATEVRVAERRYEVWVRSIKPCFAMKARHLFCLLFLLIFTSCYGDRPRPNQEEPLTSPSGKYVLTVPIETAQDSHRYWRVTISDRNGRVLYKDDSRFVGNLNVYWNWDNQDRVWLRNSDDGAVYYWEADITNGWQRHRWDWNENNSLSPPAGLLRTPEVSN